MSYVELGDCLEKMNKIPDDSVDLIVTDPPYRIAQCGRSGCGGMLGANHERQGKIFKNNDIDFCDWIPEIFRVLKPGGHCYIMINARNLATLQTVAEQAGFKFQQLLVWDKGNVTPNRWYMNACEFILMLRKGKAVAIRDKGTPNILRISNVKNKQHPTEKPVELMRILIENSTEPGDVVLDPFMGAGSTPIAAITTNRQYIGFELDEVFFNVAKQRIEEIERMQQ